MRQLTQIEVITIFGGLALLYFVTAFLRLRYKRGGRGVKSLQVCYLGVVIAGIYLSLTGLSVLGLLFIVIGLGGIWYESAVGSKL